MLVPCYNACPHLEQLADSVKNLTRQFDEVILYDDASQDGTADMARRLGFRILEGSTNEGCGFARNRLLEVCQSEWIHFQDVDDPLAVDFLERTAPYVRSDLDAVVGDMNWFDQTTGELVAPFRYTQSEWDADPLQYSIRYSVLHHGALIRRTAVEAIGGYLDLRRNWQDADLFIRLAANRCRVKFVSEVLAVSLRHKHGASGNPHFMWRSRLEFLRGYHIAYGERVRPALLFSLRRAYLKAGEIPDVELQAEIRQFLVRLGAAP